MHFSSGGLNEAKFNQGLSLISQVFGRKTQKVRDCSAASLVVKDMPGLPFPTFLNGEFLALVILSANPKTTEGLAQGDNLG